MRLAVGFVPRQAVSATRDVCIVVDVLRATTTLTCLLEQGAAGVTVAADTAAARAAKRRDPRLLLLGEEAGMRPDGFDLGNSPREVRPDLVAGRWAVCRTSNGTVALRAVAAAPLVLLGCLRNAGAVARAAVAGARARDLDISLVCSGVDGGRAFALDDGCVAGYLVARLDAACRAAGLPPPDLDDAATAARSLYEREVGDDGRDAASTAHLWSRALRRTASGRYLEQIGLGPDIDYAARVDASAVVPEAYLIETDLVVVPHRAPAANRARGRGQMARAAGIRGGEEAAGG